MIGAIMIKESARFARMLSLRDPGPVYVMVPPDRGRLEVICERDIVSVMQRAGWDIYAIYRHGERI